MTPETAGLTAALRAHARGMHSPGAAVELPIGHARWPRRDDFLRRFVHTTPSAGEATSMAHIARPDAITALDRGQAPCSAGGGRILRLATSLAHGIPVDPRGALTGLHDHNAPPVADALAQATRHR